MELTIIDRLCVLSILPKEGDITTLRILRDLTSSLGFTEDEVEEFELRSEAGRTLWNRTKDKPVEIEIGPRALSLITESFDALNRKKKLSIEHLATYEKFSE